ncbi:MAG: NAD(P)/FAD-dependent oxidoreductase, partial [Waddliaceae bacterium]
GGNAGFETAAQLLAYAKSVTLLCRKPVCKADPVTVKKVTAHPNMTMLTESEITEVKGDKFVTGISYKDLKTGKIHDLPVNGIFVEIGNVPSTDFVKDIVKLDEYNRIITDPRNQKTPTPGIWAAGDVTDELYHQNNIAAGDAVKAVEDIYQAHTAR